ncbi:MAG: hypothetical protein KAV82_11360 [Phycisphaerae bacterium]|nr:hypothetical protein [Phycisphaerae bacterium]
MDFITHTTLRVLLTLSAISIGTAFAQDYIIDWHTMDGGGEMFSTGGGFELGGTIGQPDAGVMTDGDKQGTFTLTGGFWAGVSTDTQVPGDCNGDGLVDLDDFAVFAGCMAGPQGGLDPGCGCCDLDADGDVDLADFATFQRASTAGSP